MAEDTLRAILVGVGGFGQIWLRLNDNSLGVKPVAVVDTDSAITATMATDLSLPSTARYTSLSEALQEVEADIIIDSTPPQFHLEHAMIAFGRGLHLLTAKPMAMSWAEAVLMSQLANAAGVVLAVNEQLRYGWLPLAISHAIHTGQIGKIESIQLNFREPSSWHGWRAEMAHPLLLDGAVQHFDMVRAVTGLEVESVYCRAWRRAGSSFTGAGSASALFQMTGGIPLTYQGTWEHAEEFDDTTGWWGEWRIQGNLGDIHAHGKTGLWINGASSPQAVHSLDVVKLSTVVLDQFVRAVRTGSPVATDGWNDLRSLAMSILAMHSADSGAIALLNDLDPPLPPEPDSKSTEPEMET